MISQKNEPNPYSITRVIKIQSEPNLPWEKKPDQNQVDEANYKFTFLLSTFNRNGNNANGTGEYFIISNDETISLIASKYLRIKYSVPKGIEPELDIELDYSQDSERLGKEVFSIGKYKFVKLCQKEAFDLIKNLVMYSKHFPQLSDIINDLDYISKNTTSEELSKFLKEILILRNIKTS